MPSGPYSLCEVSFGNEESDCPIYTTLSWGYDTAAQAYAARPKIAEENEVPEESICVIRVIDPGEAAEFSE